ncbi:MAG: AMP nucleosidase [Bacteriovoracaceae bacterium]|nr:AMP nucleosidase [Bacteriovoracaceae bacterium]
MAEKKSRKASGTKKVATKKRTKKASKSSLVKQLTEKTKKPSFKLSPRLKAIRNNRVYANVAKRKIALDMLERYTGHEFTDFQPQIILTNFHYYFDRFQKLLPDAVATKGSAFAAASSPSAKVTIVEFGIGSAMAALVMELLAIVEPRAVLFLGMCGGTRNDLKVGDFILPIGSIRSEGVSVHFMPPQVPALPTFKVQKFASQVLVEHGLDYRTGVVHSTDLRFWEFDENFKEELYEERVIAVEMETATLFVTAFASKVSVGALLLVSDMPLQRGGIKTKKSANSVFKNYTDLHIELGIEIMADIAERGEAIRQYKW